MYGDHGDVCAALIIVTAGSVESLMNTLVPVTTSFIATLLIVHLVITSSIHAYFICDVTGLSYLSTLV